MTHKEGWWEEVKRHEATQARVLLVEGEAGQSSAEPKGRSHPMELAKAFQVCLCCSVTPAHSPVALSNGEGKPLILICMCGI